jgi:hypothetical protein
MKADESPTTTVNPSRIRSLKVNATGQKCYILKEKTEEQLSTELPIVGGPKHQDLLISQ